MNGNGCYALFVLFVGDENETVAMLADCDTTPGFDVAITLGRVAQDVLQDGQVEAARLGAVA